MVKYSLLVVAGLLTVLFLLQNLGVLPVIAGSDNAANGLALSLAILGFLGGFLIAALPAVHRSILKLFGLQRPDPVQPHSEQPKTDTVSVKATDAPAMPLQHVTPTFYEEVPVERTHESAWTAPPVEAPKGMPEENQPQVAQAVNENAPKADVSGKDIPIEGLGDGVINALGDGLGAGIDSVTSAGSTIASGINQGARAAASTVTGGLGLYVKFIQKLALRPGNH